MSNTKRFDRRLALCAAAADPGERDVVVEDLAAVLELVRTEARVADHEAARHWRRYIERGDVADDDHRRVTEARRRALLGVLIDRDPAVDPVTRFNALALDLRASGDCEEDRRVVERAVAEVGLGGAAGLLEGEIAQAESVAGLFAQVADRDDDRYLALEDADLQRTKAEDSTALLRELARA